MRMQLYLIICRWGLLLKYQYNAVQGDQLLPSNSTSWKQARSYQKSCIDSHIQGFGWDCWSKGLLAKQQKLRPALGLLMIAYVITEEWSPFSTLHEFASLSTDGLHYAFGWQSTTALVATRGCITICRASEISSPVSKKSWSKYRKSH